MAQDDKKEPTISTGEQFVELVIGITIAHLNFINLNADSKTQRNVGNLFSNILALSMAQALSISPDFKNLLSSEEFTEYFEKVAKIHTQNPTNHIMLSKLNQKNILKEAIKEVQQRLSGTPHPKITPTGLIAKNLNRAISTDSQKTSFNYFDEKLAPAPYAQLLTDQTRKNSLINAAIQAATLKPSDAPSISAPQANPESTKPSKPREDLKSSDPNITLLYRLRLNGDTITLIPMLETGNNTLVGITKYKLDKEKNALHIQEVGSDVITTIFRDTDEKFKMYVSDQKPEEIIEVTQEMIEKMEFSGEDTKYTVIHTKFDLSKVASKKNEPEEVKKVVEEDKTAAPKAPIGVSDSREYYIEYSKTESYIKQLVTLCANHPEFKKALAAYNDTTKPIDQRRQDFADSIEKISDLQGHMDKTFAKMQKSNPKSARNIYIKNISEVTGRLRNLTTVETELAKQEPNYMDEEIKLFVTNLIGLDAGKSVETQRVHSSFTKALQNEKAPLLKGAKEELSKFLQERLKNAMNDEKNPDMARKMRNMVLHKEGKWVDINSFALQALSHVKVDGKKIQGASFKYRGAEGGALESVAEFLVAILKWAVSFGKDDSITKWKESKTELTISDPKNFQDFLQKAEPAKDAAKLFDAKLLEIVGKNKGIQI